MLWKRSSKAVHHGRTAATIDAVDDKENERKSSAAESSNGVTEPTRSPHVCFSNTKAQMLDRPKYVWKVAPLQAQDTPSTNRPVSVVRTFSFALGTLDQSEGLRRNCSTRTGWTPRSVEWPNVLLRQI